MLFQRLSESIHHDRGHCYRDVYTGQVLRAVSWDARVFIDLTVEVGSDPNGRAHAVGCASAPPPRKVRKRAESVGHHRDGPSAVSILRAATHPALTLQAMNILSGSPSLRGSSKQSLVPLPYGESHT